jgi:hypothetical protein
MLTYVILVICFLNIKTPIHMKTYRQILNRILTEFIWQDEVEIYSKMLLCISGTDMIVVEHEVVVGVVVKTN